MGLDNIRIVMVSPLYGGNVGATCRAMSNMGLSGLRLAALTRPLDMGEARMMATHAVGILDARTEYPTLADAVADCGLVMGTTARSGLYRQHVRTPREWAPKALAASETGRVAIVFGREDNGLSNDELALCTQLIQIPAAEGHTSLNVSQAVLVCAYELFLAAGQYEAPVEKSPEAGSQLRERMFEMWRESLLTVGFMKEDKADHMMLGLRRIFSRGTLTEDDVRILMGMAKQAAWAARNPERVRAQSPLDEGESAGRVETP